MRNFYFLFLASLACSCTHVLFDAPQPRDQAALREFPTEYRGIYSVEQDSDDSLIVDARSVTIIENTSHSIPLNALDSMGNILLEDGLLYDSELMHSEGIPYLIEDTMIIYTYRDRHTLGLSDSLVIKQSGKCLVLSMNFSDDEWDYWDVVLVKALKSGDLQINTIGNLNPPGNQNNPDSYSGDLKDFTKIATFDQLGENTFLAKPTKAQFAKLVRKKLFSDVNIYTRVNK